MVWGIGHAWRFWMIEGVTHAYLGPIWYHSEPSDIPYSPSEFLGWDFFAVSYSKIALKWCPNFDTSLLHQFSKFNHFLWVCWFLGKNLSNFVTPLEHSTTYTTIKHIYRNLDPSTLALNRFGGHQNISHELRLSKNLLMHLEIRGWVIRACTWKTWGTLQNWLNKSIWKDKITVDMHSILTRV